MKLALLARPLALAAVVLGGAVSVGGGATVVALKITTDSSFCNSCHIMGPYVASWKRSPHNFVPCVDCHYEPGILETFEGKFKALSQLAKYATGTQGTKPWAEVSDYSCMRSGCHSERLLEGEIQFGRIRFDHRHHLLGDRRGMQLRCTSCHSQIVQGEHLTVTTATCILCHFHGGDDAAKIDQCDRCHGPPAAPKPLGNGQSFVHDDYLKRGVGCASCHGDVTRGKGEVPRQRCGTCHNKAEHLERYGDVAFLHKQHVTDHSVKCFECHTEVSHGLPPKEQHYRGECKDCHTDAHGSVANVYRGTGGRGVKDDPSIMFLARVTCNGCHRAPFADAPAPASESTFRADKLACIDCHGPGFDGMADRWQAELRASLADVRARVDDLKGKLAAAPAGEPATSARRRYEDAAYNLSIVLLDRSDGAHNLPYARALLRKADEDAAAGLAALAPTAPAPTALAVGPRAVSKDGCTTLCHVGIETRKIERGLGYPFPHATHVTKAALDCSRCHASAPLGAPGHGTVAAKPADCAACHHPKATETEQCAACHADVGAFKLRAVEGVASVPMQDLDCAVCHTAMGKPHGLPELRTACLECHDTDPAESPAKRFSLDVAAWLASVRKPLDDLEASLDGVPADVAAEVRRDLAALRKVGPWHNLAAARAETARLSARVAASRPGR